MNITEWVEPWGERYARTWATINGRQYRITATLEQDAETWHVTRSYETDTGRMVGGMPLTPHKDTPAADVLNQAIEALH